MGASLGLSAPGPRAGRGTGFPCRLGEGGAWGRPRASYSGAWVTPTAGPLPAARPREHAAPSCLSAKPPHRQGCGRLHRKQPLRPPSPQQPRCPRPLASAWPPFANFGRIRRETQGSLFLHLRGPAAVSRATATTGPRSRDHRSPAHRAGREERLGPKTRSSGPTASAASASPRGCPERPGEASSATSAPAPALALGGSFRTMRAQRAWAA